MEEASSAGQKTISGAHVFKALEALDLEEFIPKLKEEFQGNRSEYQRSFFLTLFVGFNDTDEILQNLQPRTTTTITAYQSLQRARKAKASGKDKETESSTATDGASSKKRKPSDSESLSASAKARKSSSDAKPRDGQDAAEDSAAEEDEDEGEEGDEEADQDEEEEEEEEDAESSAEKGTLNMNEADLDDETKATALDDEGEDSDGF